MNIKVINNENENQNIAVITCPDVLIKNAQNALDLMVTVRYDYACQKMIINKECLSEDFFELRTGLAGQIMQKFINYEMALAIVGEFEHYERESLRAMIYESNKGNKIVFKSTEVEAVEALCLA